VGGASREPVGTGLSLASHRYISCSLVPKRFWRYVYHVGFLTKAVRDFSVLNLIMPRDVKAYIASKTSEASDVELAQQWAEIEDLYSRRYV